MMKSVVRFFLITILISLFIISCNDVVKNEKPVKEAVEFVVDEIVTSSVEGTDGQSLEMLFNNTKNIVTIIYNKDTIQLTGQRPASGIWYKNERYELRGKGDDVTFLKDGKEVFRSK
ncbi:MAG: MliC family protein [Bacteroidales bacterium]|nr:MliC family protein [Bacteroidales bacterium]MDD3844333.1 MliC family protein [Bacteroidales bacterium]